MNSVEEIIKDHTILEDYVIKFIKLKPAGSFFHGVCPFCCGKERSFIIHTKLRTFYCFSCDKKGDIIDFVMLYHSLSRHNTYKHLIDMYDFDIVLED